MLGLKERLSERMERNLKSKIYRQLLDEQIKYKQRLKEQYKELHPLNQLYVKTEPIQCCPVYGLQPVPRGSYAILDKEQFPSLNQQSIFLPVVDSKASQTNLASKRNRMLLPPRKKCQDLQQQSSSDDEAHRYLEQCEQIIGNLKSITSLRKRKEKYRVSLKNTDRSYNESQHSIRSKPRGSLAPIDRHAGFENQKFDEQEEQKASRGSSIKSKPTARTNKVKTIRNQFIDDDNQENHNERDGLGVTFTHKNAKENDQIVSLKAKQLQNIVPRSIPSIKDTPVLKTQTKVINYDLPPSPNAASIKINQKNAQQQSKLSQVERNRAKPDQALLKTEQFVNDHESPMQSRLTLEPNGLDLKASDSALVRKQKQKSILAYLKKAKMKGQLLFQKIQNFRSEKKYSSFSSPKLRDDHEKQQATSQNPISHNPISCNPL